MLRSAGYVDNPSTGMWRITARGRELLAGHPNGFDDKSGQQITRESQDRDGGQEERAAATRSADTTSSQQTPLERIHDAVREVESVTARDLLDRILKADPEFFERLVLRLLNALGYGAGDADTQHLGRTGDGGVDGVISLDKLGLERVYVQAKRWQGSVGRPEVQAFFGALAGRHAKKGVLIATSSFSLQAREYAQQVADSVVLVDGARLTDLMIKHGVGVTHHIVKLPVIDEDYFAQDDELQRIGTSAIDPGASQSSR
jgi:restriction system protein